MTAIALLIGTACLAAAACELHMAAQRLLEECQMMRTARSAATQCPLQGKIIVKGGGE